MAKILLVDDNDEFREQSSQLLRRAKHTVTTAANGNEALRLVQDNVFDLVITDLIMPEKEGIETIVKMRKKNPNIEDYCHVGRRPDCPRGLSRHRPETWRGTNVSQAFFREGTAGGGGQRARPISGQPSMESRMDKGTTET